MLIEGIWRSKGQSSWAPSNFRYIVCLLKQAMLARETGKHQHISLQDTAIYPLMCGTGMITMGSHAEAIDIESAWRKHINLPDDYGLRPDEAKGMFVESTLPSSQYKAVVDTCKFWFVVITTSGEPE